MSECHHCFHAVNVTGEIEDVCCHCGATDLGRAVVHGPHSYGEPSAVDEQREQLKEAISRAARAEAEAARYAGRVKLLEGRITKGREVLGV